MRLAVFLLALGVFSITPLWAQEGAPPPPPAQDEQISVEVMEQLDGDGDLKVSRKEWTKSPATFNKLDSDGDGFVTVDEFYAYQDRLQGRGPGGGPAGMGPGGPGGGPIGMGPGGHPRMGRGGMMNRGGMGQRGGRAAQAIKRMDVNGDGVISSDEWRGPPQAFQNIDSDGDGKLTKEEMKTARQQHRARMGRSGMVGGMMGRGGMNRGGMMGRGGLNRGGMMGRGGMNRGGMMGRGGMRGGRMLDRIRQWDTNNDGMIAASEWQGRPQMFQRLDTNYDDVVDRAEIKQAMEKMRQRMQQRRGGMGRGGMNRGGMMGRGGMGGGNQYNNPPPPSGGQGGATDDGYSGASPKPPLQDGGAADGGE